ncbi:MAG: isoprenylcysteine carboxylmethyltransferase family protein [Bacteroidales bacterium]|nr:isoprenylcysteine carboxylmethyltransferase family protein [Bacteroidales bacterium]
MLLFILSFLICLTGYGLHTFWHYQVYKGIDFQQRGKFFNVYTHLIVFIGYFAFGMMIFVDPLKINMNIVLRIAGIIIGLSGIIIVAIATFQKKGYSETDQLIKTGIYSRIRNPMYLGIIFIHIGLPLLFGSMITLLSALIWIPMIVLWKYWEEKHLEKKFGEQYMDYKRKTLF